jgi:hypothetical protein
MHNCVIDAQDRTEPAGPGPALWVGKLSSKNQTSDRDRKWNQQIGVKWAQSRAMLINERALPRVVAIGFRQAYNICFSFRYMWAHVIITFLVWCFLVAAPASPAGIIFTTSLVLFQQEFVDFYFRVLGGLRLASTLVQQLKSRLCPFEKNLSLTIFHFWKYMYINLMYIFLR